MAWLFFIALYSFYCASGFAQSFIQNVDTLQQTVKTRHNDHVSSVSMTTREDRKYLKKWMASGIHVAAGTISLFRLSKKWYQDFPSKRFYTVNDMNHWRMMDKCGHAWSAYTLSRLSASVWRQTGIEDRRAVYCAGMAAMGYQTVIEIMDGFAKEWGFSWGDMGADLVGVLAYMLQEFHFNKQIVSFKFMSFKKANYAADIHDRTEELFGNNFTNQVLSDYNIQTYWASINIQAVLGNSKIPPWLNIGIGYGARQMLGESSNKWSDKNSLQFDRSDIPRYSRLLVSPDIDFTRIHSNSKILRKLFYVANAIKIPAPGIEFDTRGNMKFYLLLLN